MNVRFKILMLLFLLFFFISGCSENDVKINKIKVAISPYQDIAMIVNIKNLDLEKKYNLEVELHTMGWEEILPAVASAGETIDIGFGSLIEYLTKEENLNKAGDEVIFVYPIYIFKGGAFIAFSENIPTLNRETLKNKSIIEEFLKFKIGAQKNSVYEMMLYSLSNRAGLSFKDLRVYDTPLNDGILAVESGSLDISSAGLTQKNEALKRGGRIVLTMEDIGFADLTGLVCKRSVYEAKKENIIKLIRMWFECVSYVMKDLDNNSKYSLNYLKRNSSTQYTIKQYKTALSQEYFPLSIEEAKKNIIAENGIFSYKRISQDVSNYLLENKIVSKRPQIPIFPEINNKK